MKPYDANLPGAWRLEQEALENAYARRLLIEYNIKEVRESVKIIESR